MRDLFGPYLALIRLMLEWPEMLGRVPHLHIPVMVALLPAAMAGTNFIGSLKDYRVQICGEV